MNYLCKEHGSFEATNGKCPECEKELEEQKKHDIENGVCSLCEREFTSQPRN